MVKVTYLEPPLTPFKFLIAEVDFSGHGFIPLLHFMDVFVNAKI